MSLKLKILLLAVVPLSLFIGLVILIAFQTEQQFLDKQKHIFEEGLRASKIQELKSHIAMALSTIEPILQDKTLGDKQAQQHVINVVNKLRYGQDGYFFLYDQHGVNLVHPIQNELVGRNLYDRQDSDGKFVIRELLRATEKQPHITHYRWERPSTQLQEQKIAAVQKLSRWGWILGTGLYDISSELENVFLDLKYEVSNTFSDIILFLIFTIVAVVCLVLWTNIRESRLANERLTQLAHQFVQLQVSERRQFSQELHDGINQLLAAAKFRMELALKLARENKESYQNNLDTALAIIDDAVKEIRKISHALRPALLDNLGLAAALNNCFREFRLRTNISVVFDLTSLSNDLSDDIAITIYRVVQESLTNIERHSNATQVNFDMSCTSKQVCFTISDNGVGYNFKANESEQGIGLKNMRERVELLGGEFKIHGVIGKGCQVQVSLPLLTTPRRTLNG